MIRDLYENTKPSVISSPGPRRYGPNVRTSRGSSSWRPAGASVRLCWFGRSQGLELASSRTLDRVDLFELGESRFEDSAQAVVSIGQVCDRLFLDLDRP